MKTERDDLKAKLEIAEETLDSISQQYCGESCPVWAEEALIKIRGGDMSTQLVWYRIEDDEIFMDWRFDCLFVGLAAYPELWDRFVCLGEL